VAPENPDDDYDYTYRLYLGVDGSTPLLVAPGLTSPDWSPPEGVIQAGKAYAWFVNVQDSANHSSTSETWVFETAAVTYTPPTVDAWISSGGIYRVGLSTISFEGSWIQGDGAITSKSWQIKARPDGSTCNLSILFDNAMRTTTANFVPDLVGAYTVALTVTDENGLAASIWIYDIEVVAADASGAYFFIH
ncbi:MAG: hypothetical protein Q8M76_16485, partial [Spirochaetaceae bacterium]|nr:hypothetical protein [Spirochaetaceae bacterium]